MSHREEYIAKIKLQLDRLNFSISDVEIKAHMLQVDMQEAYQKTRTEVQSHSQKVVAKLHELKSVSDEGFEQLVNETEIVRNAFVNSYQHFKSHF